MSENLIHHSIPAEMAALATLAGGSCDDIVAPQILDSKTAYAGPSTQNVINYTVPENLSYVILAIDIKTLYDTSDAALPSDFRSTDDLNPYGPYIGAGAVGTIDLLDNDTAQFAPAFDIGVINAPVLFVIQGGHVLKIAVAPNQPAGKNLTLVTRVFGYLVIQQFGTELQKKTIRIITQ